jgi:hypothetical protein
LHERITSLPHNQLNRKLKSLQMPKFTWKKEIDTTDLIKIGIMIIGAILGFIFINQIQLKNEEVLVKLELTKQIPKLQPFAQSNFSNRVDPDNGNKIEMKLYLKIMSDHYIYFFPPQIRLVRKNTEDDFYKGDIVYEGIKSYNGLFSPGTEYNIDYSLELPNKKIDFNNYDILFEFDLDTDDKIQKAYGKVFDYLGKDMNELIDNLSYKKHTFREEILFENPDFEVFFKEASKR